VVAKIENPRIQRLKPNLAHSDDKFWGVPILRQNHFGFTGYIPHFTSHFSLILYPHVRWDYITGQRTDGCIVADEICLEPWAAHILPVLRHSVWTRSVLRT
jgi:hypothetical protein